MNNGTRIPNLPSTSWDRYRLDWKKRQGEIKEQEDQLLDQLSLYGRLSERDHLFMHLQGTKDVKRDDKSSDQDFRRAICNKIIEKLPRELRDNVYEFLLLPPKRSINVRHWIKDPESTKVPTATSTSQVIKGPVIDAYLVDEEFMGRQFREEILQTFSRTKEFEIASWDSISPFLQHQRWNDGVNAMDLVSRITIEVGAFTPLTPPSGYLHKLRPERAFRWACLSGGKVSNSVCERILEKEDQYEEALRAMTAKYPQ